MVFKTTGKKFGPGITFGGEYFDCDNLTVYAEGSGPKTSSSTKSSSSSVVKSSSSSQPKSSSSAVPEGHCAVSKHEIFVGETVDWYVAGPDGEVLSAFHSWGNLAGGEIIEGEKKGNGSTKITVKYTASTSTGSDALMVQFAKQGVITCDLDEEGEPLLVVKAKEESSSSVEVPKESSSSEVKSSSSKAQPTSSSSFDPGVITL